MIKLIVKKRIVCFQKQDKRRKMISYVLLTCLVAPVFSSYRSSTVKLGAIMISSSSSSKIFLKLESEYVSTIIMALEEINSKSKGFVDEILSDFSFVLSARFTSPSYLPIINTSKYLLSDAFSNSGISFSLGSISSKVSEVSGKLLGSTNNILQFGWSSDAKFSYKLNYPFYFRTLPSDALQGKFLAEVIRKHFLWENIGLLSAFSLFGRSCSYEFRTRSAELGISILSDIIFHVDEQLEKNLLDAKSSYANIFVILSDSIKEILSVIQAGYNIGLFQEGVQIITTSFMADKTSWSDVTLPINSNINQMMKGVITIAPDIDMTSEKMKSFLSRWRSQQATIRYNSTGDVIACSNKTDDDTTKKSYLFQTFTSSKSQCNGLLYDSFAANGSDMNPLIFYVYDAIYAIAYALNDLIHMKIPQKINASNIAYLLTNKIAFEGLTGNVSFFSGLSNNEMYGKGDRRKGLLYRILNFQGCKDTSSSQFTSSCYKMIGSWQSELGYRPCKGESVGFGYQGITCATEISFNSYDNNKPLDWPNPIYVTQLPLTLLIIVWILILTCALVVVGFFIMTIVYRYSAIIKASQPSMLFVIHSGAMLAVCFISLTLLNPSNTTCLASFWLAHLSFDLVFGTLCLKTWRVYRLTSSGFHRVKVSSTFMNNVIAIAISCLTIYLAIVSILSPHNVELVTITETNQEYIYTICKSDILGYSTILYMKEAIMLVVGARLCYLVKDIPDALNESKNIALAIYVIAFLCLLLFPILFLIENLSPETMKVVKILGFTFALLTTMLSIFGSKALKILENHMVHRVNNSGNGNNTSNSMELFKSVEKIPQKIGSRQCRTPVNFVAVSDNDSDMSLSNSGIKSSHHKTVTNSMHRKQVLNELTSSNCDSTTNTNNNIVTDTVSRRYTTSDLQKQPIQPSPAIAQFDEEDDDQHQDQDNLLIPLSSFQLSKQKKTPHIRIRKTSESLYHQMSQDFTAAPAAEIDQNYIPNRYLANINSNDFFDEKENVEKGKISKLNENGNGTVEQREIFNVDKEVDNNAQDSDNQTMIGCRSFSFNNDTENSQLISNTKTYNQFNSNSNTKHLTTTYGASNKVLSARGRVPVKSSKYATASPSKNIFISHDTQEDITDLTYADTKTDTGNAREQSITGNTCNITESLSPRMKHRMNNLPINTSAEIVGKWSISESIHPLHSSESESNSDDDDDINIVDSNAYFRYDKEIIKSAKSTDALLSLESL